MRKQKSNASRRTAAEEQAQRLAGLKAYPQEFLARQALADALVTAPSLAAMERFVDEWLRDNLRCPMPKTIYDTFKPPDAASLPKSTGCSVCAGTGWRVIERPDGISGAKRCQCITQLS